MSFYKKLSCANDRYKVIQINECHVGRLKDELRKKLAEICYGIRKPLINSDDYVLSVVCSNMVDVLENKTTEQKFGIIGELLMYLVVPDLLLDRKFESISLLMSLTDKNIKHGFDLNFYEGSCKKIWYGEVKSGTEANRVKLIGRAKKGLVEYFNNLQASGKKNTRSRWEAAKNEVFAKYYDKKGIPLSRLLDSSRTTIERGEGGKNAVMMVVEFGRDITSSKELLNCSDIELKIKQIEKVGCFDDFIIVAVHKKVYEDIIEFFKEEGSKNE